MHLSQRILFLPISFFYELTAHVNWPIVHVCHEIWHNQKISIWTSCICSSLPTQATWSLIVNCDVYWAPLSFAVIAMSYTTPASLVCFQFFTKQCTSGRYIYTLHTWCGRFHGKSSSALRICEQGRGRMWGPKCSRNGNMKECECSNFSSIIGRRLHCRVPDASHS